MKAEDMTSLQQSIVILRRLVKEIDILDFKTLHEDLINAHTTAKHLFLPWFKDEIL